MVHQIVFPGLDIRRRREVDAVDLAHHLDRLVVSSQPNHLGVNDRDEQWLDGYVADVLVFSW